MLTQCAQADELTNAKNLDIVSIAEWKEKTMSNPTAKTSTSTQKSRFNYLKAKFHQAPLPEAEHNELMQLAKKFSKKMAAHLAAMETLWGHPLMEEASAQCSAESTAAYVRVEPVLHTFAHVVPSGWIDDSKQPKLMPISKILTSQGLLLS